MQFSPGEQCIKTEDCAVGTCVDNPSGGGNKICSTRLAFGSLTFFFWIILSTWVILWGAAIRKCCQEWNESKKRADRAKKKATGASSVKRQDHVNSLPGVKYVKRVAQLVHLSEGYVDYVEDGRYEMTAVNKATDEERTEVSKRFRIVALVYHMILHSSRWVEGVVEGNPPDCPEMGDTHGLKPTEIKEMQAQYANDLQVAEKALEARTNGGTQEGFVKLEKLQELMLTIVQSQDVDEIKAVSATILDCLKAIVALMPEGDANLCKEWYEDANKLKAVEEIVIDEEYFFDKTEYGVRNSEERRRKSSWMPECCQFDVRHWYFYMLYFGIYFVIVFVHIIFRLVKKKTGDDALLFTFLGLGPAYDLANNRAQLVMVPAIYGVMHASLYTLTLVPVPFARGVWRDLVKCAPGIRSIIPVDDLIFLHRMWGIILLSGIMTGASFWILTMGASCLAGVPKSCFAFHPKVKIYFDPVENVLFLRILVWITWFFIIPLMEFARNEPPAFCFKKCKQYWWEVAIYLHVFIAIFTTSLALYARFPVFLYILAGWGLYYLDKLRERLFHTHKVAIVIKIGDMTSGTSRVHLHSHGNLPVSVHTVLTLPAHYRSSAGQWIYFHVPGIDRTWHPFTLASASDSSTINLEIGIRGSKEQWVKTKNDLGVTEWEQPEVPCWTYKLYRLIRHTLYENRAQRRFNDFDADKDGEPDDKPRKIIHIDAYVRGPYGAAYEQSLDPKYGATVLAGAGTGVTSPLSALRDIISRRSKDINVPNLVWFIWSTQAVDDLLWLWDSVFRTLYSACKNGAIAPKATHRKSAKTLDWLGFTVYISQADGKLLKQFVTATRPLTDDDLSDEALRAIAEEEANNGKVKKDIEDKLRGRVQAGHDAVNALVSAGVNAALSVFKKQDDKSDGQQKRQGPTAELSQVDVHDWMTNDKRLLTNSMDDKATHVLKLLRFISQMVGGGGKTPISVAYCGPSSLSFLLNAACKQAGPQFDYVSDTL